MQGSGLFADGMLDRHREGFARIRAAYPWTHDEPVSSHNDLNPSNFIFDGKRLWIVDWEIAFKNEPLVDIATTADHFATTAALEETLLYALRGRTPDRGLRVRLALMRQLTRLFRGCTALSLFALQHPGRNGVSERPLPDQGSAASASRTQQAPATQNLQALGMRYLDDFLLGLSAQDFELTLAEARHG